MSLASGEGWVRLCDRFILIVRGAFLYFPFVFIWANFRLEPWGHYSWLFCWHRNTVVEVAKTRMIQVGSIKLCLSLMFVLNLLLHSQDELVASLPFPFLWYTTNPEPIRNNVAWTSLQRRIQTKNVSTSYPRDTHWLQECLFALTPLVVHPSYKTVVQPLTIFLNQNQHLDWLFFIALFLIIYISMLLLVIFIVV